MKCTYPVRSTCPVCFLPHVPVKGSPRFIPCEQAREVAKSGTEGLKALRSYKGGVLRWKLNGADKEWQR